jgi:hypothetical protein
MSLLNPRVAFEFHGMCCAAPVGETDAGGKKVFDSLDVVMPRVDGHMPHVTRLLIPTEWVVFQSSNPADDCVAVPGGATFYVWKMDGRELSVTIGASGKGEYKSKLGKPEKPQKGEEDDIRWVPSLGALTGLMFDDQNNRKVNSVVNSVVHVVGGGVLQSGLAPLQSLIEFRQQTTVKDKHVLAERLVYEVPTVNLPAIKLGGDTIQLAQPTPRPPALTITVSHLPTSQDDLAPGTPLPHFREFYKLMKGGTINGDPVPHFVDRVSQPMIDFSPFVKWFFPTDLLDLLLFFTTSRGGRPVQCGPGRT